MSRICILLFERVAIALADDFRGQWRRLRGELADESGFIPLLGATLGREQYTGKIAESVLCEFHAARPLAIWRDDGPPDLAAFGTIFSSLLQNLQARHHEDGVQWEVIIDAVVHDAYFRSVVLACVRANLADAHVGNLDERLSCSPLAAGSGTLSLVTLYGSSQLRRRLYGLEGDRWGLIDEAVAPLPHAPARFVRERSIQQLLEDSASGQQFVLTEADGAWTLRGISGLLPQRERARKLVDGLSAQYLQQNPGLAPSSWHVLEIDTPLTGAVPLENWLGRASPPEQHAESSIACVLTDAERNVLDRQDLLECGVAVPCSARRTLRCQRSGRGPLRLELVRADASSQRHYPIAAISLDLDETIRRDTSLDLSLHVHRSGALCVRIQSQDYLFKLEHWLLSDGSSLTESTLASETAIP